jgi:ABC-type dipeptide/oligopeptide/nickel transport system ATPase component
VEELLLMRRTFNTSIILVTHNIGVVSAMADRILVLKDGETVEYGESRQILHAPQMPYTKALMDAVPKLRRS